MRKQPLAHVAQELSDKLLSGLNRHPRSMYKGRVRRGLRIARRSMKRKLRTVLDSGHAIPQLDDQLAGFNCGKRLDVSDDKALCACGARFSKTGETNLEAINKWL